MTKKKAGTAAAGPAKANGRGEAAAGAGGTEAREFRVDKLGAAYLLGVSPRSITRAAKQDGLPVEKKGRGRAGWTIDPQELVRWAINQALEKERPAEGGHQAENLRLLRERADRTALENQLTRGQMILTQDATEGMQAIAAMVASELSSSPARCANELAGADTPAKCRSIHAGENRRIRQRIAERCREFAKLCRAGRPIRRNR